MIDISGFEPHSDLKMKATKENFLRPTLLFAIILPFLTKHYMLLDESSLKEKSTSYM